MKLYGLAGAEGTDPELWELQWDGNDLVQTKIGDTGLSNVHAISVHPETGIVYTLADKLYTLNADDATVCAFSILESI